MEKPQSEARLGAFDSARRPKHIILGIDGTWQAAFQDTFQSNVHRLNIALEPEDSTAERKPQIFIYSAGVGTSNRSSRAVAGATGEGLDAIILEAYINLASNYVAGDQIYVFGFSRGAFAARALTGFISYAGLLKASDLSFTEQAWKSFTDGTPALNYLDIKARHTHKNVRIEFLGLWDTVAGPYRKNHVLKKYRFGNFKLDKIVRCAVHVISIDDSRRDYEPIPFDGCSEEQMLEQIWMPGVHTDVGGGYRKTFLSTLSLLVMIDKLKEYCPALSFDKHYISRTLLDTLDSQDAIINNERTGLWKFWGRSITRQIKNPAHHKQHPIVELLREKEITYKTRRTAYSPRFLVPTGEPQITPAQFAANSWHCRAVTSILAKKFGS